MRSRNVLLVVFTPLTHADSVRQALGAAGAGVVGYYSFCSFSSRGVGRYRAGVKANPVIGEAGAFEAVEEERIEVTVQREIVKDVVAAVKVVHPYEEVPFYITPLEDLEPTS